MRLIDKDRLLKGSNHYWLEMENFGDIESIDVRFVEMAEEVKAVPIEWLKRYAKKGGRIANILFPFEIEMMLEDWEKENEVSGLG